MSEFCAYIAILDSKPVYVGQTSNLERRKVQHRYKSEWFSDRVEWKVLPCDCRNSAKRLEARLIRSMRPVYNKDVPRLDPENSRDWKEQLTAGDLKKLTRRKEKFREASSEYNALRLKLKSKADALIRAEKAKTPPPSKQ